MEKTVFGSYYAASRPPARPRCRCRPRCSPAAVHASRCACRPPSAAPTTPSPAAGSAFRYGTLMDPLPTAAVGASLWAARIFALRLVMCDSTASLSISQTHSMARIATRTFVTDSLTVESTATQRPLTTPSATQTPRAATSTADYFTVTAYPETCTAAEEPTGTASVSNESQSGSLRRANATRTMTAKTRSRSMGRGRPPHGKGVPYVDHPFVFKSNNNDNSPRNP